MATTPIKTGETYQLSWVDDAQTILQLDIIDGWTWEDAYITAHAINAQISAVEHDVYTIYHFTEEMGIVPRQFAITHIKALLEADVPNEKLVIMIAADSLLARLIETLAGIYRDLAGNASKLRFLRTLEDAYRLIADCKNGAINQGCNNEEKIEV